MNDMPMKQKALVAVFGIVALYAIAAALWFTVCGASWRKAAVNYSKAKDKYLEEERLIAEKGRWCRAYEDEKSQMPVFEEGESADNVWKRKLDAFAAKHHIELDSRGDEKPEADNGEVKEIVIEVGGWKGALESMVGFLHELENTNEGMFDISSLTISPAKGGYLRGNFNLTCAFMRK